MKPIIRLISCFKKGNTQSVRPNNSLNYYSTNNRQVNFLTLENVTKSYGEKVLFKNITLYIDKGQKIGLIAKNGTGKTTLMRVIAGKEGSEGEQAKILLRKDIRIGWLDQEPYFSPGLDVLSAVLDPSNPLVRVVQRYERALEDHDHPDELQLAIADMDLHNAWTFEAKVKEMLFRFRMENFSQQVSTDRKSVV